MHNHKGFTLIEALLIIAVASIIGFGGYYVLSQNDDTPTTTEPTKSDEQLDATFSHSYYSNETKASDKKVTINYPSSWVAETVEGDRCTVRLVVSGGQNHSVCVLERGFGIGDPTTIVEDSDHASPNGNTYTKKLFKNAETNVVFSVSYIPKYSAPFDAILISNIPDGKYDSYAQTYESIVDSIAL